MSKRRGQCYNIYIYTVFLIGIKIIRSGDPRVADICIPLMQNSPRPHPQKYFYSDDTDEPLQFCNTLREGSVN